MRNIFVQEPDTGISRLQLYTGFYLSYGIESNKKKEALSYRPYRATYRYPVVKGTPCKRMQTKTGGTYLSTKGPGSQSSFVG